MEAHHTNDQKPKRLVKKSYLSFVRNSVGTEMFRNFYIKDNGVIFDAANDGEFSCAFYVSGLLSLLGLAKKMHGTIASTEKDLIESGWVITNQPTTGCIVKWGPRKEDPNNHEYIGFYLGNNRCVSSSSLQKKVVEHPLIDKDREILAFYTYPILLN